MVCGQDAACVAESAIGVSRFSVLDNGDLYACVTLPNLIVGALGGGTGLPSQSACIEILGLPASDAANALSPGDRIFCLWRMKEKRRLNRGSVVDKTTRRPASTKSRTTDIDRQLIPRPSAAVFFIASELPSVISTGS